MLQDLAVFSSSSQSVDAAASQVPGFVLETCHSISYWDIIRSGAVCVAHGHNLRQGRSFGGGTCEKNGSLECRRKRFLRLHSWPLSLHVHKKKKPFTSSRSQPSRPSRASSKFKGQADRPAPYHRLAVADRVPARRHLSRKPANTAQTGGPLSAAMLPC